MALTIQSTDLIATGTAFAVAANGDDLLFTSGCFNCIY